MTQENTLNIRRLGIFATILFLDIASLCVSQELDVSANLEVPEPWIFDFDSRPWHLAHQEANIESSVREYVLEGETVEAWIELVTSASFSGDDTVKDVFDRIKRLLSEDCPSLRLSIIEKSASSMLFEWRHMGCRGYPPQHELKRIARGRGDILVLSYVGKTPSLSEERRRSWISILRAATPAGSSSLPTPSPLDTAAPVPGVSLVNHASALKQDALENLVSFARQKYWCGFLKILDTEHERDDGRIMLDGQGRLVSGLVAERWAVEICGTVRNLALLFQPDGKGGTVIAIAEIKSHP